MADDKGICPCCNEEFTVLQYGCGIRCPLCKSKIDVLPDPDLYITTPVGVLEISGLKKMWESMGS